MFAMLSVLLMAGITAPRQGPDAPDAQHRTDTCVATPPLPLLADTGKRDTTPPLTQTPAQTKHAKASKGFRKAAVVVGSLFMGNLAVAFTDFLLNGPNGIAPRVLAYRTIGVATFILAMGLFLLAGIYSRMAVTTPKTKPVSPKGKSLELNDTLTMIPSQ
jgi:hypothetical protein